MRKSKILVISGALFCAAFVFAQTLPPAVPSKPSGGYVGVDHSKSELVRRRFQIKGKEYMCTITWQEAKSGLEWEPTSPLPLTMAKAEEIARNELSKIAHADMRWQVTDFSVSRFRYSQTWCFALTLKPEPGLGEEATDSFTVLMNSSGTPGRIARVAGAGPR